MYGGLYNSGVREIPNELLGYFNPNDFGNYPRVSIPQSFLDERGEIINIADGMLGDVAVIHSKINAVRANHVHESDWHLSYCLTGSLNYSYREGEEVQTIRIRAGELFFTPAGVPHRMDFMLDTTLVVVSRNSRKKEKYEEDTRKYILNIEEINE